MTEIYPLILTLVATLAISFLSFTGALTLIISKQKLQTILIYFVSLSAGTLMGGAFLHLIPEALNELPYSRVSSLVIVAFILFFLIEKVLRWHHHHEFVDEKHTLGHMNLIGDSVHNFLDGLIIAASFAADIRLGFITSAAVVLHEVPQEIGDFGVLLHSGYSIKKALVANLFVALISVIGALVGFLLIGASAEITPVVMALAAGGFIYISTSDLLPEIRSEMNNVKSWVSFIVFVVGIVFMSFVG